jgi:hypothetical protein
VVRHDQRYTVDEALRDSFFRNNAQLTTDLRELEEKLGQKWISPLLENLLPQQESFDQCVEQIETKTSAVVKFQKSA